MIETKRRFNFDFETLHFFIQLGQKNLFQINEMHVSLNAEHNKPRNENAGLKIGECIWVRLDDDIRTANSYIDQGRQSHHKYTHNIAVIISPVRTPLIIMWLVTIFNDQNFNNSTEQEVTKHIVTGIQVRFESNYWLAYY